MPAVAEWWVRTARSRKLTDVPHEALTALLRAELAEGPRSSAELIAAMERAGFARPFWEAAGLWLDMVRVPPSGTWERRRADRYGLAEQWVPPLGAATGEVSEEAGLRLLLVRYLGAFGPAALADAATWAGVPRARLQPVASAMDLRTFRDEDGRVLLDLGDAAIPDPETPAPVRFLPTWDATLLAHCRRSGILPEPFRQAIFHTRNPAVGRNRAGRRCGRGDVGVAQQPGRGRWSWRR